MQALANLFYMQYPAYCWNSFWEPYLIWLVCKH